MMILTLRQPWATLVAEVDLIDCIELNDKLNEEIINENNIAYGNKRREGYAWKIKTIRKINSNKKIKGKLGLWNIYESKI